jgi:hypothetical protein
MFYAHFKPLYIGFYFLQSERCEIQELGTELYNLETAEWVVGLELKLERVKTQKGKGVIKKDRNSLNSCLVLR